MIQLSLFPLELEAFVYWQPETLWLLQSFSDDKIARRETRRLEKLQIHGVRSR